MKINLSKHDVVGRSKNTLLNNSNIEFLGLKELPLSYINTKDTKRSPKVIIEEDYLKSSKKKVIPYSSFSSDDIYLFNNKNEILDNITFKRIGSEYYFEVPNQIEYNPLRYSVYLEIKKNLEYRNDKEYKMKVSVVERDETLTLSNKIISIFGDKNVYGNCPFNIIVNDGSKIAELLISSDNNYSDSDFLFVESDDGIHLGSKTDPEYELDLDTLLENHTNVWISCKDYKNRFKKQSIKYDGETCTVTVENNILFDATEYEFDNNKIKLSELDIFDKDKEFNNMDSENGRYIFEYLNEVTLLIHKQGYGYVIITPEWVIDNLKYTDKIVYEVLMNVFLKSYIRTKSLDMWIVDEPVDYLAYHKKKFNRCHNIITLNDFLINSNISITDNYSIINVKTSTNNVSFVGINNKNELMFTKTGGEIGPKKKNDEVSYYTTKHSIINYNADDIFMIETPLVIETTSTDSGVYLTIKPVYSTSKKLRVDEEQTFKITNFATQYNIFVDKGSRFISNTFYVVPRTDAPERGWSYVGVVSFELSEDTTANDTRIMGGGLPLDQPDDFDMLDIGHIYGRPYRLGSTYIIKLPKKVSNFDKRIRSELDKHIAAGDEYVIHYNNE